MAPLRPRISLLVTDLDNTLWDWFHMWHSSFSAMLEHLSEMSGVPSSVLEGEMREVHRRHGTTEYSLLLDELPSLRSECAGLRPLEVFDAAVHTLNHVRKRSIHLYRGVESALTEVRRRGVPIVAYTESIAYWTEWRIRETGLDGVVDVLYSSPDHDFPEGVTPEDLRRYPPQEYGLVETVHRHTPQGRLKPDPAILGAIVDEYSKDPEDVVYIGDSLMKDVAMAQEIGVHDVHARYGVSQDREGYELLRRVSHWSTEDIERERRLARRPVVVPTWTARECFSEVLDMFEFQG
ncbi:HAD family hydrolase [Nocardiopsis chromatogenes]|uniref:HAD family hydrolase n=1 Tax=Nocardiopsis chromatogenes TaxID=280239 RepID=UPI00036C9507|nr:HAD family hydrolase [Nocardiopsis chromatogenes]